MKRITVLAILMLITFAIGVKWESSRASAGGRFDGLSVVYFLGGSEEDEFAKTLEQGALAAESDFGPSVTYIRSNWDVELMTQQFADAVASGPDCIVIPGHPGEARLGRLIREAVRSGITVSTVNVPIPELERGLSEFGFGYVGQDQRHAGASLADAVIRDSGAPVSTPVIVVGLSSMAERGLRSQGIKVRFLEAGYAVRTIEITDDMHSQPLLWLAEPLVTALRETPGALLVVDYGVGSAVTAILKAAGIGPDEHYVAVYDVDSDTPAILRSGYVDLAADQQGFLQGYLSLLQVCFASKYGFNGLSVDTGISFLTREKLAEMDDSARGGVR